MLLQAFGVPPATVEYVRTQISTPQITQVAPVQDTVPIETPTIVSPATIETVPAPLVATPIVPLCNLAVRIVPSAHGGYATSFSWHMSPGATGLIVGVGHVPTYTSDAPHPPLMLGGQSEIVKTYTLIETMTDPAYQATTTCQATADASTI